MTLKNKAVVFGGSGFLGSYVADALSEANYEVVIFDRVKSPWLQSSQKMVIGDIMDKQSVVEACKGAQYIYNFAGLADINEAKDQPERTIQLNVVGNLNILEAARSLKVERFVFASSVYVYSESGSFYRVSKQTSEKLVELYSQNYGLPFTILRYGSLYGSRADARNGLYRLIEAAVTKKQMTYQGNGEELREYIHAEDAARASVEILKPEFKNQHIVLTGMQSLKIKDVMLMISEILGGNVKSQFDDRPYEAHYTITPYAYKPRLGKKFIVNPFIDLGQGVLDCIHEIDKNKKQNS